MYRNAIVLQTFVAPTRTRPLNASSSYSAFNLSRRGFQQYRNYNYTLLTYRLKCFQIEKRENCAYTNIMHFDVLLFFLFYIFYFACCFSCIDYTTVLSYILLGFYSLKSTYRGDQNFMVQNVYENTENYNFNLSHFKKKKKHSWIFSFICLFLWENREKSIITLYRQWKYHSRTDRWKRQNKWKRTKF